MSDNSLVYVDGVHLARREAILSDGRFVPVNTMFDEDGLETDDIHACAHFIAGGPGEWFLCDWRDFEGVPIN